MSGVVAVVTLKCRETLPDAGTLNGPLQIKVLVPVGLAVVTPVVLPETYENPPGSVSVMLFSETLNPFGLDTVSVYPSCAPGATR
jgi:hypothetical protein